MVTRWAIIRDGIVDNIILWDGKAPWAPPKGTTIRELTDSERVGPGFTFDGKKYIAPVVIADAQP